MTRVIERALRYCESSQKRDESGERRGDEQDPPAREKEADRPEEIEEHHEAAPRLWRQEFGKNCGVHHQHPAESESCQKAEAENAPWIPGERGEGCERGVPDNAEEEHVPPPSRVRKASEREAPNERANQRGRGNEAY